MITKRLMAPLLASLVLGLAAAPAQAATVSYSVSLITSTLTFSGPQGGNLIHEVNGDGSSGLNEFDNGFNDGAPEDPNTNYLITSLFSGGDALQYDGVSLFMSPVFSFYIDNTNGLRDFTGAGYELFISFLVGDAGDPFDTTLTFDLPDLGIGDYFTAQFFLSDIGDTDLGDVFIGEGLWLSGLVPDPGTSQIGGTPGGGTDVPEPGSLALLGLGLVGLGAVRRARRLR